LSKLSLADSEARVELRRHVPVARERLREAWGPRDHRPRRLHAGAHVSEVLPRPPQPTSVGTSVF
jgi:hypothetical protein